MRFYHTDCECGNPSCLTRIMVCADETTVGNDPNGSEAGVMTEDTRYEVVGKLRLPRPVVEGIASLLNISRDPTLFVQTLETLRHIEEKPAPSSLN